MRLVALNKPFQVLSQFTDASDKARDTLATYIQEPGIYACGRLDYDSEGLLLLSDSGVLQQRIADPRFKLPKTYWVQVEGIVSQSALEQLCVGVPLKDGLSKPAQAKLLTNIDLWDRHPPIRERAQIPTSWLALTIREGRNRQVRRMTAAVGFPTLRLVRMAIGPWNVHGLAPGEHRDCQIPPDFTAPQPNPRRRRAATPRRRRR